MIIFFRVLFLCLGVFFCSQFMMNIRSYNIYIQEIIKSWFMYINIYFVVISLESAVSQFLFLISGLMAGGMGIEGNISKENLTQLLTNLSIQISLAAFYLIYLTFHISTVCKSIKLDNVLQKVFRYPAHIHSYLQAIG